MKLIVFIPGIMGSALAVGSPAGQPVWPPTPFEAAVTGYRRLPLLVRQDLVATEVIRSVCVPFYGPLLERLEAAVAGRPDGLALVEHAYDWRRDLDGLAEGLAQRLEALAAQHGPAAEIVLVCHSMGGLIARACLERPRPGPPAWLRQVRLAMFLAVPHEGAPLAFARATGIGGGSVGLDAEAQRTLSAAPGFPAAYQLFPPQRLQPVWQLDGTEPFLGLDLFDSDLARTLDLNLAHLESARAFHALLDPARRPPDCRYFAVASATHETVTRFDLRNGALSKVEVEGSGDGTVPVRSAAALPVQTAYVDADHVGVTHHANTLDLIDMLLGVLAPDHVAARLAERRGGAALSLSARVLGESESYEIVVLPGGGEAFAGVLRIARVTQAGEEEPVREIPLEVSAPGVTKLSLHGPRLPPGQYRFRLVAEEETAAETDLVVMREGGGT